MASQQLCMFGNVLFRNVAETLLWWLVGRTTVAKWHGAKKYRSMFSTAHKGRYQSSSRSARMNNKIVKMCSMRQLTGLMPTTSILNMTVPACFPDGWRIWFGTAICWGFDASDPRFSYLKEAMLSTDIIFTNICCDAKKWKCESVRTSYWIHTWGKGVVFWQWNNSVVTSASISVSAVVYYRFKRLIVDVADMSSKGPGFAYQHAWESRPCHKLPSSRFVCWSACRDYLPRLKSIPLLSQASHGLVVSLHTTVVAESQNISSVYKS